MARVSAPPGSVALAHLCVHLLAALLFCDYINRTVVIRPRRSTAVADYDGDG